MRANRCCDLLKFLRSEGEGGGAEAHVFLALHGYEVDVGVGDFESEDALAYLDAGDGFLYGYGYALGKDLHGCYLVVFKVEDVVDFTLGYDEGVAFLQGVDVEEGEELVVLGYLVAGYLACYDA